MSDKKSISILKFSSNISFSLFLAHADFKILIKFKHAVTLAVDYQGRTLICIDEY